MIISQEGNKDKKTNFYNKIAARMEEPGMELQLPTGGPVTDDSINNPDQNPIDEEATFMDMMGQKDLPNVDVNEILSTVPQLSMTEEPTSDAAQMQRLNTKSKLNALGKGLQLIFGGLQAASGEYVPAPYNSPMTGFLNQEMQRVDDRYWQEVARVRDQNFRRELINVNLEADANNARLRQLESDADRAYRAGQAERGRELEEKALALRERGLDLQEKQQNADNIHRRWIRKSSTTSGKQQPRLIPDEHRGIVNSYINTEIERLRNLQDAEVDEAKKDSYQDQIEALELKNYELDNPTTSRVYGQAIDWMNSQVARNENVSRIMDGIQSGAYQDNPDQLQGELMDLYIGEGMSEEEAMERTNAYMNQIGLMPKNDGAAPLPENFETRTEYIAAQKAFEKRNEESRPDRTVEFGKKRTFNALDGAFADGLEMLDADVVQTLQKEFKKNPEQAVGKAITALRSAQSEAQSKEGGRTGSTLFNRESNSDEIHNRIQALQRILKEYQEAHKK